MCPSQYSCFVCGCGFEGSRSTVNETSWYTQYRISKHAAANCSSSPSSAIDHSAVYARAGGNGVAVTGVGTLDHSHAARSTFPRVQKFTAPLRFSDRWQDGQYIACIGVLEQPPVGRRHGIPIHEACWSLVQESWLPEPVPVARLHEVLCSVPYPLSSAIPHYATRPLWYHDPEFFAKISDKIARTGNSSSTEVMIRIIQMSFNDPMSLPTLSKALEEEPDAPPIREGVRRRSDCLSRIPLEVLLIISSYLPLIDIKSARLAAPSFTSLFYSQAFWASRFRPGCERDWVFESRRWSEVRNWRWMHQRTALDDMATQNRQRVWRVIRRLNLALDGQRVFTQTLPIPNPSETKWWEVTGDIQGSMQHASSSSAGPWEDFTRGCRIAYEQQTYIPSNQLRSITFFVIHIGQADYIAGARLAFAHGSDVHVGYQTSRCVHFAVTQLRGFMASVGQAGIHGVQCVFADGQLSSWAGSSSGAQTSRLILSSHLTGLKAAFDGSKMVSLGVSGALETGEDVETLQRRAIWSSDIPSSQLMLNEYRYFHKDHAINNFHPLEWIKCGGSGARVQDLIQITVSTELQPSIKFYYKGHVHDNGRSMIPSKASHSYLKSEHFVLDGPAGERIQALTAYYDPPSLDNYLVFGVSAGLPDVPLRRPSFQRLRSFKITTNLGRFCYFMSKPWDPLTAVEVQADPGTAITGFYWSWNQYGMISLGAISEPLEGEA